VHILNVLAIVTLLMGGTASASESQDSVPTDTELHSVYCIPVVQARIRNEQGILALLSAQGQSSFPKQKEIRHRPNPNAA